MRLRPESREKDDQCGVRAGTSIATLARSWLRMRLMVTPDSRTDWLWLEPEFVGQVRACNASFACKGTRLGGGVASAASTSPFSAPAHHHPERSTMIEGGAV